MRLQGVWEYPPVVLILGEMSGGRKKDNRMTKKTLAASLDGRKYPLRLSATEEKTAKDAGLVIVYGASDDLVEFEGAIYDEAGAPGDVFVTANGLLESHDDCDCKFCNYKAISAAAKKIEVLWCDGPGEPEWTFKTEIPHETFTIIEDGEPFCRGLVFSIKDLA